VEVLAPATSPDADWLDPDVFFLKLPKLLEDFKEDVAQN